ncbi:MAG: hypothetical protein JXB32_06665 [Deltaproteobacteria bacterium]|nr:hypothetical protein [Deltaproteobacteria bacterium]
MNRWSLLSWCCLAGLLSGDCGDDTTPAEDADVADDAPADIPEDIPIDTVDPAWYEPDPEGRLTEGNLREADPEMLVIAPPELADAWQAYARHRNLTGIPTRVVTTDEVFAAADGADEADRLRNYLGREYLEHGLRFALLGGDAELVPFRRVEASVTVPFSGTYTTNGPTDLFFAELDADWDRDGDGRWGERIQDLSLDELRQAELAVGRVPAGDAAEVGNFVRKVAAYEADANQRGAYPLFFSDLATTMALVGDIDGAEAMEITIADVFPPEFRDNAWRLYTTDEALADYGGEPITARRVAQRLRDGYPLSFHNGHGSHWYLANPLDGDWARGLDNAMPTVLASCACLSANFADVADDITFDLWTEQGPGEDSAAELLITGPCGAVGYVGNTAVGLGPVGGVQLLDAFYRAMFEQGLTRLGEALNYGRAHIRDMNLVVRGIPMPTSDDTEWWTLLAVILLGDPALPMWIHTPRPIELTVPATYGPGWQELTVHVSEPGGIPAPGATVVALKDGDFVLRGTTDDAGDVVFRFIPTGPAGITVRATAPWLQPVEALIAPL